MRKFDLSKPAANGLMRGYTTGSCATAAVKAALLRMFYGEEVRQVEIVLPGGEEVLQIPIESTELFDGGASARVIKDAGDDPDQTHKAAIISKVLRTEKPGIEFVAGQGVGTVTREGLQISVGEPAINPVPRAMMELAVEEVCADLEQRPEGFTIEVACEDGEQIAKRTFNPRLGIEGGISILGTTGIVEPKSLASFKASIEIYINVALAGEPDQIVFSPGNLGQRFARESLELELSRVVQMSNFVGFALDHLSHRLEEENQRLPKLWVVGHPGKLAKLVDGHWDTHSSNSPPATEVVERIASKVGEKLENSNTVEACISKLGTDSEVWKLIGNAIHKGIAERVRGVDEICVRLFAMSGQQLK